MDIHAPRFPESVDYGQVVKLHVAEKTMVKADHVLFDIETDKVILEVLAPSAGFIDTLLISQGDQVQSEQFLASFTPELNDELEQSSTSSNSETIIRSPLFPEAIESGRICRIHASENIQVQKDGLLIDIETEHVVFEIVAPFSGYIEKLLVSVGDCVKSDQAIAIFHGAASAKTAELEEVSQENAIEIEEGRQASEKKERSSTSNQTTSAHTNQANSFWSPINIAAIVITILLVALILSSN